MSKQSNFAMTAVLALLSIFPPLATDMYLPALATLATDMQTTSAHAEFSLSIFFLGLCIGQLIVGPAIDAYGRKLPLLCGAAIFTLTSIAMYFVQDITVFNTLRFLQALGACCGMVISRAIVTDLYEGPQVAKTMTVLVMLMTIGPIVSPTLGSLLFEAFGWRSIFLLLVLIGITAFILAKRIIPETLAPEKRVQRPFYDAFKNAAILIRKPSFVACILTGCLVQAGMFAFITGSSGIFQGVYGLSAFDYGLTFAGIGVALFCFGRLNHQLLNHFTPQQILSYGLPFYTIMAILTVLASATHSLWILIIPLWLTIGMVSLLSANSMSLAMINSRERAGVGSALLGVFQFGMAFIVSSAVAVGGGHNVYAMSFGIFIPACLACVVWFTIGRNYKTA